MITDAVMKSHRLDPFSVPSNLLIHLALRRITASATHPKQDVMAAGCVSSADKKTRLCGYLYKVMAGKSI